MGERSLNAPQIFETSDKLWFITKPVIWKQSQLLFQVIQTEVCRSIEEFRPGFLNLSTTGIWVDNSLLWGTYPTHCRIFSSISHLFSPGINCAFSWLGDPYMSTGIAKCPNQAKSPWVKNHWGRASLSSHSYCPESSEKHNPNYT